MLFNSNDLKFLGTEFISFFSYNINHASYNYTYNYASANIPYRYEFKTDWNKIECNNLIVTPNTGSFFIKNGVTYSQLVKYFTMIEVQNPPAPLDIQDSSIIFYNYNQNGLWSVQRTITIIKPFFGEDEFKIIDSIGKCSKFCQRLSS